MKQKKNEIRNKNFYFFEKKEITKNFKMLQFRASSVAVVVALATLALLLFVAKDVEAGLIENLDEGTL